MKNDIYDLIENINQEYLYLQNSKEYRMGKRIYKIKHIIQKIDVRSIIYYIKSLKSQRQIKKISKTISKNEIFYCKKKLSQPNAKCVVYTCITNNYDAVNESKIKKIDHIMFSDRKINSNTWEYKKIPTDILELGGNIVNRYYKMHPFELFSKYDYAIYVDGNIQIVSDVTSIVQIARDSKIGIAMHLHPERDCIYKEAKACIISHRGNKKNINSQIRKYNNEGFPHNFGLLEATIIVVDLKNKIAKKIFSDWYNEFCESKSGRDQLSLPYVIWKNGYKISDVGILVNYLFYNQIFRIRNLGEHKFK